MTRPTPAIVALLAAVLVLLSAVGCRGRVHVREPALGRASVAAGRIDKTFAVQAHVVEQLRGYAAKTRELVARMRALIAEAAERSGGPLGTAAAADETLATQAATVDQLDAYQTKSGTLLDTMGALVDAGTSDLSDLYEQLRAAAIEAAEARADAAAQVALAAKQTADERARADEMSGSIGYRAEQAIRRFVRVTLIIVGSGIGLFVLGRVVGYLVGGPFGVVIARGSNGVLHLVTLGATWVVKKVLAWRTAAVAGPPSASLA